MRYLPVATCPSSLSEDLDADHAACAYMLQGITISSQADDIVILESAATMIFIVEKDATFQSLIADGICRRFPCIVITVSAAKKSLTYGN